MVTSRCVFYPQWHNEVLLHLYNSSGSNLQQRTSRCSVVASVSSSSFEHITCFFCTPKCEFLQIPPCRNIE